MQINPEYIIFTLFILLGLAGFFVATYIFVQKNKKKKLICPLRTDCSLVVNSDYSVVGPFRVEVLGMIYYFVILALYTFAVFYMVWTPLVKQIFITLSGMSALFSVYLIAIQGLLIRQWCIWCVSSAVISVLMFLLTWYHLYI